MQSNYLPVYKGEVVLCQLAIAAPKLIRKLLTFTRIAAKQPAQTKEDGEKTIHAPLSAPQVEYSARVWRIQDFIITILAHDGIALDRVAVVPQAVTDRGA